MTSPIITIQPGVFPNAFSIREDILACSFENITSDVDGVTYPGICLNLPDRVKQEFITRIEEYTGHTVEVKTMFARAMLATEISPHKVHSDDSMGQYSAHVYLSIDPPKESGTAFFDHATEGKFNKYNTDIEKIDHKSFNNWTQYDFCPGHYNTLLVHRSEYWHCALPTTGWGISPRNGRLVLTCFYNIKENT